MNNGTLHVIHASGNTFMPQGAEVADIQELLARRPDILVVTEVGEEATFEAIKNAAGAGYHAINPDSGDIAFLVTKEARILGSGGPLAVKAQRGPASEGGHGERRNSFVTIRLRGEVITHTGVHFVTAHPGHGVDRRDEQVSQAHSMALQVTAKGHGRNLSTGSGDLNADLERVKEVAAVFDRFHLTTTAEETGDLDPTHGHSHLDYVWSYDKDHRVSVRRMRVLHGVNSDHNPVEVFFDIVR